MWSNEIMADWQTEIQPKMRKILNMLKNSPLPLKEKVSIRDSVKDAFTQNPKLASKNSNSVVYMQDELVKNFDFKEWQQLRREYAGLGFIPESDDFGPGRA